MDPRDEVRIFETHVKPLEFVVVVVFPPPRYTGDCEMTYNLVSRAFFPLFKRKSRENEVDVLTLQSGNPITHLAYGIKLSIAICRF